MSDIVERLRSEHRMALAPIHMSDAADEIVRLREVAEAADSYHDVVCDPDWCRLCRALAAWKEARRG